MKILFVKHGLAAFALTLTLAACGSNPSTVTVTGPTSSGLKIGEATALSASFKDGSGAVVTGETFTWTSSAPGIAAVDQSGNVTAKRFGTVTISATATDGISGSSALLTTYGLEVVGGTSDTTTFISGGRLGLAVLFRLRGLNQSDIPASTPFTIVYSGPNAWNGGATISRGVWQTGAGGVSYWDEPAASKTVISGVYQASTSLTVAGVTTNYTTSFSVDATQTQARAGSIAPTSATVTDVSATWTAASGASYYRMYVADTSSTATKSAFTSSTGATLTGLGLKNNLANYVIVGAMNFNFTAGLDAVAPAQFNIGYDFKQLSF